MRVLVTPNAQYRQAHAQSVLAALGIGAILTDAAGDITAEMTEQQFSLFALRAGAHQCRILDGAVPVPAPVTVDILPQAVPGEPITVRLARQRAIAEGLTVEPQKAAAPNPFQPVPGEPIAARLARVQMISQACSMGELEPRSFAVPQNPANESGIPLELMPVPGEPVTSRLAKQEALARLGQTAPILAVPPLSASGGVFVAEPVPIVVPELTPGGVVEGAPVADLVPDESQRCDMGVASSLASPLESPNRLSSLEPDNSKMEATEHDILHSRGEGEIL